MEQTESAQASGAKPSPDSLPSAYLTRVGDLVADDKIAYKVLTATDWMSLNARSFLGSSVDLADGFIHLSTASQITETVERHFSGQTDLIVAAIDLRALGDAVRWETSRHGQLFPHVYASLPPSVVLAWCYLERQDDGAVRLPGLTP